MAFRRGYQEGRQEHSPECVPSRWKSADLCAATDGCANVFNLGASYWSSVLAAYCPRYWERVSGCVVEGADSVDRAFLDKRVLELDAVTPGDEVALVFGTSPATHKALRERFSASWKHVVSWDRFLPY